MPLKAFARHLRDVTLPRERLRRAFPRAHVSRLYDHISALCHRAGVRFHVTQEAVQFPTILGLVAARTGIAVVPEPLQYLRIPGVRYLALADEDAVSVVSLVHLAGRADDALIAACREVAAGLTDPGR